MWWSFAKFLHVEHAEALFVFLALVLIWYFVRLDADVGEDEFDRSPNQGLRQDQDEGHVNEGKLPLWPCRDPYIQKLLCWLTTMHAMLKYFLE